MLNELVNGIAFGSLLFVLASGFTLSLGLIKVINIAHGAFYMLGAYVAISATRASGSFVWGAILSSLAVGLLAVVLQLGLLRRLQFQPLRQVLCTFGVTLVVAELCRQIWGSYPQLLETPAALKGTVKVGSVMLPGYRLFVVVVAVVLATVLWLVLSRTRVGAIVRACIDDQEVARTVGIDVDRVFALMFGFAGMLAGLGGAIGAPFLGAYQGVEFEILALTLVVVVIGGLGSILGAFVGSMLIGIVNSVGTAAFPELSYFLLFGPMILILLLRPQGLLGLREGR